MRPIYSHGLKPIFQCLGMRIVYSIDSIFSLWRFLGQFIVSTAASKFEIYDNSLQFQLWPLFLVFKKTVYSINCSLYFWHFWGQFTASTPACTFGIYEYSLLHRLKPLFLTFLMTVYSINSRLYFSPFWGQFIASSKASIFDVFEDSLQYQLQPLFFTILRTVVTVVSSTTNYSRIAFFPLCYFLSSRLLPSLEVAFEKFPLWKDLVVVVVVVVVVVEMQTKQTWRRRLSKILKRSLYNGAH